MCLRACVRERVGLRKKAEPSDGCPIALLLRCAGPEVICQPSWTNASRFVNVIYHLPPGPHAMCVCARARVGAGWGGRRMRLLQGLVQNERRRLEAKKTLKSLFSS